MASRSDSGRSGPSAESNAASTLRRPASRYREKSKLLATTAVMDRNEGQADILPQQQTEERVVKQSQRTPEQRSTNEPSRHSSMRPARSQNRHKRSSQQTRFTRSTSTTTPSGDNQLKKVDPNQRMRGLNLSAGAIILTTGIRY